MRSVREFGYALTAAFLSVLLTLGALSISLVGFIPEEAPPPTETPISTPIPITPTNTIPPTSTPLPGAATMTYTATSTVVQATNCPPPPGWVTIIVAAGESLDSIAARYGVTKDYLKSFNCLISDYLPPGTTLNVPNNPTRTSAVCVPGRSDWARNYIVKSGDTFYNIAFRYFTTDYDLKRVNCRATDYLAPGEILWVPKVTPLAYTSTPAKTSTPTNNFTVTPLFTEPGTMLPYTLTPSSTPTIPPPPPTSTVTPIPTPTSTASLTSFPSATSTP
jgi:LysM repeat protein